MYNEEYKNIVKEKTIFNTMNNNSVLNEVTIYNSQDMVVAIALDDDRNYGSIAYFKVYVSPNLNPSKGVPCARVLVAEPKYIKHNGHVNLKRKQKTRLIEILKSPANNGSFRKSSLTTYQCILNEYNGLPEFKDNPFDLNSAVPDYTLLKDI